MCLEALPAKQRDIRRHFEAKHRWEMAAFRDAGLAKMKESFESFMRCAMMGGDDFKLPDGSTTKVDSKTSAMPDLKSHFAKIHEGIEKGLSEEELEKLASEDTLFAGQDMGGLGAEALGDLGDLGSLGLPRDMAQLLHGLDPDDPATAALLQGPGGLAGLLGNGGRAGRGGGMDRMGVMGAGAHPRFGGNLECRCGFECGSVGTLKKHLAKFPGDKQHAPLLEEAHDEPSNMEPVEVVINFECRCGFTSGTGKALEKHFARFSGDKAHGPR